jgi:hypothetical protein
MLEVVVLEIRKQHAKVEITQSLDVSIITIGVETVVMRSIEVIREY